MSINVVRQSILELDCDVIVNPANSFLMHGAGLARTIAHAAGAELIEECSQQKTVATGTCVATTAGKLPFKAVIHTVGPIWAGGDHYEKELLALAHTNPMWLALAKGWDSIAFPAVSCGLYRFPVSIAAPIAIEVAKIFSDRLKITFALFEDEHYEVFTKALESRDTNGEGGREGAASGSTEEATTSRDSA